MEITLQFRHLLLRPFYTYREMNVEVADEDGYICRLVPGLYGFDLSPLDQALGNDPILPLLPHISEFILQQDA